MKSAQATRDDTCIKWALCLLLVAPLPLWLLAAHTHSARRCQLVQTRVSLAPFGAPPPPPAKIYFITGQTATVRSTCIYIKLERNREWLLIYRLTFVRFPVCTCTCTCVCVAMGFGSARVIVIFPWHSYSIVIYPWLNKYSPCIVPQLSTFEIHTVMLAGAQLYLRVIRLVDSPKVSLYTFCFLLYELFF